MHNINTSCLLARDVSRISVVREMENMGCPLGTRREYPWGSTPLLVSVASRVRKFMRSCILHIAFVTHFNALALMVKWLRYLPSKISRR